MTHSIDYKGYTIYCENGLYYIGTIPHKKYFTFQAAKDEVDKKEEGSSIVDLRKLKN
jgi:hypothetical protein